MVLVPWLLAVVQQSSKGLDQPLSCWQSVPGTAPLCTDAPAVGLLVRRTFGHESCVRAGFQSVLMDHTSTATRTAPHGAEPEPEAVAEAADAQPPMRGATRTHASDGKSAAGAGAAVNGQQLHPKVWKDRPAGNLPAAHCTLPAACRCVQLSTPAAAMPPSAAIPSASCLQFPCSRGEVTDLNTDRQFDLPLLWKNHKRKGKSLGSGFPDLMLALLPVP